MSETRTISLDSSSNGLTWDFVEKECKKLGFPDVSKFTVYCYEKQFFKKYLEKRNLIQTIILCLVFMSFILLLMLFMGG